MSENPLLRLLEKAHPGRSQADLLAMIEATPNRAEKSTQSPARRRIGARPRTSASVERRRSLASQGWFPPAIAARFTVGEQATLAVIAQEVARYGSCQLFIEKIAALAGIGRSTVKRALKEAQELGLIRVEEKRLSAWRNDANVITILDPAWLAWLRMRRREEGSKKKPARNTEENKRGFRSEEAQAPRSTQKASEAQTVPRPDTATTRDLHDRPGLEGGSAKRELPSVQRWGVHGNARLRGA